MGQDGCGVVPQQVAEEAVPGAVEPVLPERASEVLAGCRLVAACAAGHGSARPMAKPTMPAISAGAMSARSSGDGAAPVRRTHRGLDRSVGLSVGAHQRTAWATTALSEARFGCG